MTFKQHNPRSTIFTISVLAIFLCCLYAHLLALSAAAIEDISLATQNDNSRGSQLQADIVHAHALSNPSTRRSFALRIFQSQGTIELSVLARAMCLLSQTVQLKIKAGESIGIAQVSPDSLTWLTDRSNVLARTDSSMVIAVEVPCIYAINPTLQAISLPLQFRIPSEKLVLGYADFVVEDITVSGDIASNSLLATIFIVVIGAILFNRQIALITVGFTLSVVALYICQLFPTEILSSLVGTNKLIGEILLQLFAAGLFLLLVRFLARMLSPLALPVAYSALVSRNILPISAVLFLISLYWLHQVAVVDLCSKIIVLDGLAVLEQSKLFSKFALFGVPPLPAMLPDFFLLRVGELWTSILPPGAALLALPFVLTKLELLFSPFFGAICCILVFFLVHVLTRLPLAAILAWALCTFSPFVQLVSAQPLSHAPMAALGLSTLLWLLYFEEKKKVVYLLLASGGFAVAFLVRPLNALVLLLPLCAVLVRASPPQRLFSTLILSFGPGLLGLYNYLITGSVVTLGYIARHGEKHAYGFGERLNGDHTLSRGVLQILEQIIALNNYVCGIPLLLIPSLLCLRAIGKPTTVTSSTLRFLPILLIAFYIPYWHHDLLLGPRYLFDAAPILVILGAMFFAKLTPSSQLATIVAALLLIVSAVVGSDRIRSPYRHLACSVYAS